MIKTVDADIFFARKARPGVVPDDADIPDWNRLIHRTSILDSSRYPLDVLVPVLRRENLRIGAGKKSLQLIDSIDNKTVFVVAGQQAGLFGGPLYTLYKAFHAARLSHRLSGACGKRVLPLFWIASDDHDFDEVRGLGLRTGNGLRKRVEYTPLSYREGMPVGEVILDEGIESAVEQLAGSMPTGDRAEHYLEIIRSSWKPGTVWSDAFAAQLSAMCASYGLILVDPRWQGIKEKFVHIMAAELRNPRTSALLVNEEADKFEDSQNRRKALRRPEGLTSLFLEIGGIRHILRTEGTGFLAGTEFFTEAGLLDMLQSEPGCFSPGAALRPVCQDAIFPVAALIGGPGERRYLEQIRPLYEVFGVDGSIVWPRASFTLIDQRVERTARREGIPLETFFDDPEKIRAGLASESFPHEITGDFESLERSMREGFARLAGDIGRLDATLVQSVEKDQGKVLHILEGIKGRAMRAHKASSLLSEKRFSSATYFLQPDRGPQERWFGSDAAFMMLGEEGLQELTDIMSPGEERHRLVFIDEES